MKNLKQIFVRLSQFDENDLRSTAGYTNQGNITTICGKAGVACSSFDVFATQLDSRESARWASLGPKTKKITSPIQ